MSANRLAFLTLALLAGCGGDRAASMAADSLSRDLQRIPVDSSALLNDQAAATPVAAVAPKPAPAPLALGSGTTLSTTVDREITSRTDKPGASVTGTVASDVMDASGRVVIPAGSKVTMTITEIHESENKGDKTGKLTLTPTSVQIGGESYTIGGAVGTQRAIETQDRDVVVPANSRVEVTLGGTFTR